MKLAVLGGIKSLEAEYKKILKSNRIKAKVMNTMVPSFDKVIGNVDGVIMFTDTVSHKMALSCSKLCKKREICLIRHHKGSLNSLFKALDTLSSLDLLPADCPYKKI